MYEAGVIQRAIGHPKRAVRLYERAISIDPEVPEAYYAMGNAFRSLKWRERAVLAYNQALHLYPRYEEASYNLALTLEELRRRDEAIDVLQKALALGGRDIDLRKLLACLCEGTGRFQCAETQYRQIIKRQPTTAAYSGLISVLYDRQAYIQLVRAVHAADRRGLADAFIFNLLGCSLDHLERFEDAIVAYKRALQLDPEFAEAYSNLSIPLSCLGRDDEAHVATQKALELGSRSQE